MTLRHVIQGEFAIGSTPDTVISSTLGSCVSICLWDPKARVGGMNHMLLPDSSNIQVAHQFGSVDMERLVNALMRDGAKKENLSAKAFGGASMLAGATDIGRRNSDFCLSFLAAEGIACVAESLGGTHARQVRFWPWTGRAKVKRINQIPQEKLLEVPITKPIELF